ncbi:cell division protein FtsL [Nocardioides litoris]|uniref:cell division protein FtsL n=1 Tax=Nocardioides litoris TaxID=1926648 RepID=UPI0014776261|nr:cell division protein FtsL [Nocardioides litoris]
MSSPAPQRRTRLAPHLAGAAVGRARLAVVPRLRSRAPRVPFVVLVSMLLLTGVVGLLLFNTSMQQASFTAARLEDQAEVLAAREQALTLQLEEMRNPTEVARQACALGMVIGPPAAFLDLRTGTVEGKPGAADASTPAPCPGAARPAAQRGVR